MLLTSSFRLKLKKKVRVTSTELLLHDVLQYLMYTVKFSAIEWIWSTTPLELCPQVLQERILLWHCWQNSKRSCHLRKRNPMKSHMKTENILPPPWTIEMKMMTIKTGEPFFNQKEELYQNFSSENHLLRVETIKICSHGHRFTYHCHMSQWISTTQNSLRCCWTWYIVRTFTSLSDPDLHLFGALTFRSPHITSNMRWCCGTLLRPYCYCHQEWPKHAHRGCCHVAWQGMFPCGLYSPRLHALTFTGGCLIVLQTVWTSHWATYKFLAV